MQNPNSNQDKILQLWQMVKNSPNQEQMFAQIMASNPEFAQIVNTIKTLGDPRATFYKLAEQKGEDPNKIINMLK